MTSVGDLRHRVKLQGVSDAVGDGGGKTRTYPEIAHVWAELKPSQIPVKTRAGRIEFVSSMTITCPYSAIYLTARRIVLGVRIFQVKSIINLDEQSKYVKFQCEEVG